MNVYKAAAVFLWLAIFAFFVADVYVIIKY